MKIPRGNPKPVMDWSDVTERQITAFHAAVWMLRDRMLPVDCDGDHRIEVGFRDKLTEELRPYQAVPKEGGLVEAVANVRVTVELLERKLREAKEEKP